jgi:hypothetical protein
MIISGLKETMELELEAEAASSESGGKGSRGLDEPNSRGDVLEETDMSEGR